MFVMFWILALLLLLTLLFTRRKANVYKPYGFFLGFLITFIYFCVTVLFHHYLYFVVNKNKKSLGVHYKKQRSLGNVVY